MVRADSAKALRITLLMEVITRFLALWTSRDIRTSLAPWARQVTQRQQVVEGL